MRRPSRMRVLYTAGVLAGSLALLGCPKRPEVAQAGPGAIGPAAATVPAPTLTKPSPQTSETPVTRATPPVETPITPAPAKAAPETPGRLETSAASALKDVFFNFDDATIRSDQKTSMDRDFEWLRAHPGVQIRIEGNCDERGTAEYNLALGDRRANAAKDRLVAEGISADRIATLTYGKERPFVLGHDESAWQWNRRDHFVLAQ